MKLRLCFLALAMLGLLFGLLAVSWMGNASRLMHENDRACDSNPNQVESNARFQDVLDVYSAKRNVGLQATVIFPDGSQWDASSGFASREKKCPVSILHHFGVGSVTKLYTAALVMRQVDAELISLDDSISQWLDLPYTEQITVRMLLNHTSGISDYTSDATFLFRYIGLPEKSWQPSELLDVIKDKPLRFEPGFRYEYSNSNYLLLGIILEKISGKPYAALLKEMTDELGLRDTFYLDYPDDILIANAYDENLLRLGVRNLAGLRISLHSGAYSAGGIVSQSSEVAHFTRALFMGRIVPDKMLAEMMSFVHAPEKDAPERIGYGLGIRLMVFDRENFFGHTGAIPGYSGVTMFGADGGITITILGNLSVIEQERLLAEILETVKP